MGTFSRSHCYRPSSYTSAPASGRKSSHSGKAKYEELCAACHKVDGTGEPKLGAPDLTSGFYTYGGDSISVKDTILYGREGVMPAFNELLDDMQIKLLAAWLAPER